MTAALPPLHINKGTVRTNAFSKHDNRHMIQNYGIYLGTGLGKKLFSEPGRNQHWSDSRNFVPIGSQQKYTSTYSSGYRLRSLRDSVYKDRCSSASVTAPTHEHPAIKRSKFVRRHSCSTVETRREQPSQAAVKSRHTLDKSRVQAITMTKNNLHRFPHRYTLPKDLERARPSVNTEWWYRDKPVKRMEPEALFGVPRALTFRGTPETLAGEIMSRKCTTSLAVLSAAQQPLLKKNSWKY